jgi:hypothetical protein
MLLHPRPRLPVGREFPSVYIPVWEETFSSSSTNREIPRNRGSGLHYHLYRSAFPHLGFFWLSHWGGQARTASAPAGRSVHKTGAVFAPGADRSLVFLFRKEKARGSAPCGQKRDGRAFNGRPTGGR